MVYGMPGASKYEKEEDIISVLKQFPNCPKLSNRANTKLIWGTEQRHIDNWKQAQKWLKEKENSEPENTEYTKELEQKIKDQEERIKELENKSKGINREF
ncbi:MAG: hypothetical protein ACRC8P_00455 [Spiroplasma sp.]